MLDWREREGIATVTAPYEFNCGLCGHTQPCPSLKEMHEEMCRHSCDREANERHLASLHTRQT